MTARLIRPLSERQELCFTCPLPECNECDTRCPYTLADAQRPPGKWAWLIQLVRDLQPNVVEQVTFPDRGQARSAQSSLLKRRRDGRLPAGLITWTRTVTDGPVHFHFMIKPT